MSATLKPVMVQEAGTQDEASPLLDKILTEMNAIAAKQSRVSPIRLRSFEEIERFAERAAGSGMVPKDYISKPDAIIIAVQMGSELGLTPMQSLINISVINGRPAVWGDAMPGLCRASGQCAYIKEWHEGEGEGMVAYCEARRKDDPNPIRMSFSVAEAKKAGLWGKNIWSQYPVRMLQMRARGFCLRDAFPDVLRGLISIEEARDMPFEASLSEQHERPAPPRSASPENSKPRDDALGMPADPHPKPKTYAEWLDDLERALMVSDTTEAVEFIVSSPEVQKMSSRLRNGARERYDAIIAAARTRVAGPGSSAPVNGEPINDEIPF